MLSLIPDHFGVREMFFFVIIKKISIIEKNMVITHEKRKY
jgi:hypothetical protein